MKLLVFILGAAYLVSGRPRDKYTWNIEPLPKPIITTGGFGGTYNYATKRQRGVYEPEEYGKISYEDHRYDEGEEGGYYGYGKHHYGHDGIGAQREYTRKHEDGEHRGKVTSGHREHGALGISGHGRRTHGPVENGEIVYIGSYYHGRHHHDTSNEKYGIHKGGRKDEYGDEGYEREHHEKHERTHEKKSEINGGTHTHHQEEHINENTHQDHSVHKGSGGFGDYSLKKHEVHKIQEPISIGEYEHHDSKDKDHNVKHEHKISNDKREKGEREVHIDYALEKHDEHKLQVSGIIGEDKHHDSQNNAHKVEHEHKLGSDKGRKEESGGHSDYAWEKHEEQKHYESGNIEEYKHHVGQNKEHKVEHEHKISSEKIEKVEHGGKSAISFGEPHISLDHSDHKETHGVEEIRKKEEKESDREYPSGTYDIRNYEHVDRPNHA